MKAVVTRTTSVPLLDTTVTLQLINRKRLRREVGRKKERKEKKK